MNLAISEAGLELAPMRVVIGQDGVFEYLARHPELADLLPSICEKLRDAFGSTAELALQLYTDPEIKDSYLTLFVRMPHVEPDFFDRIDAVCDEFYDKLDSVSGYLLVSTDFRAAGS